MSSHNDNLIIVIGRGHSGTRILSQALFASGVYIGKRLNPAGDKLPAKDMYYAAAIVCQHVRQDGDMSWDFSRLHTMEIESRFVERVEAFLEDVHASDKPQKGWKLPETTLAFPWLARMYPDARYVHIVRDPRDALLRPHLTDDLTRFGIPCPATDDRFDQRVASWKFQHEIVKATPRPTNFASIRFEDLVLDHDATMAQLEDFLGIPLARVVVDRTRVGLWRSEPEILTHMTPLEDAMRECGYIGINAAPISEKSAF